MSLRSTFSLALLGSIVLVMISSCAGPTDRDQVLDLVKKLARYAEDRDVAKILARIDEDYADSEGRDKDATRGMLEEYFARFRGIAINVLRSQVDALDSGQAEVQADLAFSSGAAKVFRKFAQISMDNYRLKVKLKKSGSDWLVTYAEWRVLGVGELLSGPER